MNLATMAIMDPHTWMLIGGAGAAGAVIGLLTQRHLNSLAYRLPDETKQPAPDRRQWVVWATVIAWLSLAARAALDPGTAILMLPLIPLAACGAWLAAVDFDVLRLPNRVIVPTMIATAALVAAAAVIVGSAGIAITSAIGMLAVAGTLALISVATNQVGFGDVKLAVIIGLSLGAKNPTTPLVAVIIGSIVAYICARTTKHQGPLPYGPWLILGGWAAALIP
jgi:leader peptidase (prepilin peptidase)/N-methyltransferase